MIVPSLKMRGRASVTWALSLFTAIVPALAAVGCAGGAGGPGVMPLGTVINGYDDADDARVLRARLSTLRDRYRRSPALPFSVAQYNLVTAKQWIAEGIEPLVAVENSLQGSADDGERDVRYWCLPAEDLSQVRFPAELLRPIQLNIAISVFRQAEPKNPRYYVLLATYSLDEYRQRLR
jgi:hypothetical protein